VGLPGAVLRRGKAGKIHTKGAVFHVWSVGAGWSWGATSEGPRRKEGWVRRHSGEGTPGLPEVPPGRLRAPAGLRLWGDPQAVPTGPAPALRASPRHSVESEMGSLTRSVGRGRGGWTRFLVFGGGDKPPRGTQKSDEKDGNRSGNAFAGALAGAAAWPMGIHPDRFPSFLHSRPFATFAVSIAVPSCSTTGTRAASSQRPSGMASLRGAR